LQQLIKVIELTLVAVNLQLLEQNLWKYTYVLIYSSLYIHKDFQFTTSEKTASTKSPSWRLSQQTRSLRWVDWSVYEIDRFEGKFMMSI
jgi:hypothetical protein